MANNVDPDEAARYEPSHLDLHCLQMYIFLYWSVGMKDSIYFVDCLPVFTKEKIFATFYLLLCALSPFGKGSTPKKKKLFPMRANSFLFPFVVDPFPEGNEILH